MSLIPAVFKLEPHPAKNLQAQSSKWFLQFFWLFDILPTLYYFICQFMGWYINMHKYACNVVQIASEIAH